MKNNILAAAILTAAFTAQANAAIVVTDTFAYPNGPLAGQGPWVQNAATATNPITVAGGTISLTTTGQDVFQYFTAGAIPATDGTSAYFGLDVNVSAAQATGDYFAHFLNGTTSSPTLFSGRLAARSGTTGYVLGYSESTAGGTTYGTTELAFGTTYRVVLRYDFVAGTANDTGAIYVAQGSFSDLVEANNTPYVTDTYGGATAEIGAFTGFQFRQGTAANAPTIPSIDNLTVATTFTEAASPVPEPTTVLTLISGVGMLGLLRRRTARA